MVTLVTGGEEATALTGLVMAIRFTVTRQDAGTWSVRGASHLYCGRGKQLDTGSRQCPALLGMVIPHLGIRTP